LEQDLDFYTLYINDTAMLDLDVILGQWTAEITITEPGTHDIELSVTSIAGQESSRSNMVNFTVGPRTPGAPANLTILP